MIPVTVERRMFYNDPRGKVTKKSAILAKDFNLPMIWVPMVLELDDVVLNVLGSNWIRVRPDVIRGPGEVIPLVTLRTEEPYTDEKFEAAINLKWKVLEKDD